MDTTEHITLQDLPYLKSPLSIFWEVSSKCNLNCLHCYTDSSKTKAIPDRESILTILSQIIEADVLALGFGGGEPLILPYIHELIYMAETNGIKTSISTNGVIVNENTVKKLTRSNLSIAQISIDGPEKIHDQLRGKGVFKKAIQCFKMVKSAGIETRAAMTVTKLNYQHIKETLDICFEAGADRFVTFRYVPEGRKNKELMLSIENLMAVTSELLQIEKDYPDTAVGFESLTFFPHLIDPLKLPYHKCNAGIDVVNIISNGDVTPCPHARDFVIGNIRNQTLQEIWNEWLNKVDTFHNPPNECLKIKCEFLPYCNGGCRGSGINENSVAQMDPYCWKINHHKLA
mgnify:CR=1 FL=1